jgi:hypothetical protein
MTKFFGLMALSACLLTPVATLHAQDHADHGHMQKSHQWNDSENEPWHQYLKEHHKKDHDWSKASKREQNAYWKWRDQHHDSH